MTPATSPPGRGSLTPLLRAAVAVAAIVVGPIAAAAQTPALTSYQELVDRYQRGTHVASVIEVLKLDPADARRDALLTLEEHDRRYELSRVSVPGQKRLATHEGARAYIRLLQAVAALHLEAAISAPFGRYSQRLTHLDIAEAALAGLDASRKRPWTRDPGIDDAARAAVLRFRRDWWLVAAAHFQRIGAFADALRLVRAALDEHRDDPVFHLIAGTMAEALAAPVASFDNARAAVGLPPDPDDAARLALRDAARHFERALALNRDDVEARVRLARVRVQLGAFDAARLYLAAEAPRGRLAYLLALARGHAATAEKRHADAVDHYRAATSMAPGWQSGCIALAHALVAAGQRDEARGSLRTCISREPALDDPWSSYGMGLHWLVAPAVRQLRVRVGAEPVPE